MESRRSTDSLERYYICRGTRELYSNYNISIQLNKKVDRELLSNALRKMVLKAPYLAVNAFRDENKDDKKLKGANFHIEYLKSIEFSSVASFEKFRKVDSNFFTALDELLCPLDVHVPMWRVIVFENGQDQVLTFYCDHTLFDGVSGLIFMKNLVKELDQCSQKSELKFVPILFDYEKDAEISGPIPQSAFANLKLYSSTITEKLPMLVSAIFIPEWLKYYYKYYTTGAPDTSKNPLFTIGKPAMSKPRTAIRLVSFTPEQSTALLKICKANKVTFTPLVTTLALYSIQETIMKKVSSTDFSTSIGIDIDGRRFYPEYADNYGLCMAASPIQLPHIDLPARWFEEKSALKQISKSLLDMLRTRSPFKFVGLLDYVNPWELMDKKLTQKDFETFGCSNVGVQEISSGSWKSTEAWFSQSTGVYLHAVASCISQNGKVNVCVGFSTQLVDIVGTGALDQFEAHIQKTVENLVQTTQN